MSAPEHEDPPSDDRPMTGREFIRSLALADVFTLCNAGCGVLIVILCSAYAGDHQRSTMQLAFGLFPVALICDLLDGWVARKRRSSIYGAELDSLADVISFGVAPTAVGFALGLDAPIDVLVLVGFVLCGVARLARFNVTAEALTDDRGKVSHFEGTPIPTSVLIVLVIAVAFHLGLVHDKLLGGSVALGPVTLHPIVRLFLASGAAMVSSIRIPKP